MPKERFKFFDFFATCEYFEKEFSYDEKIKLPHITRVKETEVITDSHETSGVFVDENGTRVFKGPLDLATRDEIESVVETSVGEEGMRIDREGFKKALEEDVLGNKTLKNMWNNGDLGEAEDFTKKNVFNNPKYFLNLEKIRKLFNVDRRISVREFLQVAFGQKEAFEMKDDLLESEWEKFVEVNPVDQDHFTPVKSFFKAYIVDEEVRDIIKRNTPADFYNCATFDFEEYQKLNSFRTIVPTYVKDYIPLNTFMS